METMGSLAASGHVKNIPDHDVYLYRCLIETRASPKRGRSSQERHCGVYALCEGRRIVIMTRNAIEGRETAETYEVSSLTQMKFSSSGVHSSA